MKILNIGLILLISTTFNSCRSKPAIVVDRSNNYYTKNKVYGQDKYSRKTAFFSKAAQFSKDSSTVTTNEIIISPGETLYSISRKYGSNLRDLIEVNNLSAPYYLQVGSKIIIPSASYHEVVGNETIYTISRKYNMNVNELIALNKLEKPYEIKSGQRLKINVNKASMQIVQPSAPDPQQEQKKIGIIDKMIGQKNNNFLWPIKGSIISGFGPKKGGLYNDGLNIAAKDGEEVKSAEDGVVAYVGNELKGYGNLIIIKHYGGWITAYGHLSDSKVKRGDKVEKSQVIASAGATGNVDSTQLYFALRKGRDAVNPENYLKN